MTATLIALSSFLLVLAFELWRLKARREHHAQRPTAEARDLPDPSEHAVKLGERLRLATTIADYSARADIESFCHTRQIDTGTWWDTAHLTAEEPVERQYVTNAVEYLHLRQRIVRHPLQQQLVRFTHER